MIRSVFRVAVCLLVVMGHSCKPLYNSAYQKPELVDDKSARTLKKLHKKLFYLSKAGFGVGHQDDMAYGIGWNYADDPETLTSDVKKVTGRFPAVFGFDIAGIEKEDSLNIDGIPFTTMRKLIIKAHQFGGIITISWHAGNPVSGGNSWDVSPAVSAILSDEAVSQKYDQWLSRVAGFIRTLKFKGKKIPIIFRPWHEMNGNWFWWGSPNCSAPDYVTLWQKTVNTLKNQHKLHNLLYTYSPNKLNNEAEYLNFYPGDEYVDLLGIDIYDFNNVADYLKSVTNDLAVVQKYAEDKGKLYAFTETGLEKIGTSGWFSESLYPAIENTGIAWILFWRNARKDHHYAPYLGHPSEADFRQFEALPKTIFLEDLKNLED